MFVEGEAVDTGSTEELGMAMGSKGYWILFRVGEISWLCLRWDCWACCDDNDGDIDGVALEV